MSLSGTLKDFGVADILQLVGRNTKSGVLLIESGNDSASIYFHQGSVVRAESATRKKRELLGNLLVRAEVITEAQLYSALETQRLESTRRLGQILVDSGALDARVLSAFTRLQASETVLRLFVRNSGTYEFTQQDVPADCDFDPIRSETLLMEGFRQIDEWPKIRRKITGYDVVFEVIDDLDKKLAEAPAPDPSGMDGFDDMFGNDGGGGGLQNIGANEKAVYRLINHERSVRKIVDLSQLGEFETCKALEALIDAKFIRALAKKAKREQISEVAAGAIETRRSVDFVSVIGGLVLAVVLVAGGVIGARAIGTDRLVEFVRGEHEGFVDTSLQHELSTAQMARIGAALELYRVQHGAYPQAIVELVNSRLLANNDLSFPWEAPYAYTKTEHGYALVRPLF